MTFYRLMWRYLRPRLRWDIDNRSRESRRRLRLLSNTRRGENAVVVCNGPSLNDTDLTLLDGVYTFGLNKINLLFDRSSFRPSAIVAVNRLVIEQNCPFFNTTNIPLFISCHCRKLIHFRSNVTFVYDDDLPNVSTDAADYIAIGGTVTAVALQLAYYMGFGRVALVGCDHNFAVRGLANATAVATGPDVNHFAPNYFSGGVSWQFPDLVRSEYFYDQIRNMYEADGRQVINCTEGGSLEIFKRMSLKEFVGT